MRKSLYGLCCAILTVMSFLGGIANAGQTVLSQPTNQPTCNYFPITIQSSGSYILGSNLTLPPSCDKNGVQINADNVVLDLGGFAIIGKHVTGTGAGVYGAGHTNIVVNNGTVTNMPGNGIVLGDNATVSDVTVTNSVTGDGVQIGSGVVQHVHSSGNKKNGIVTGNSALPSRITDCVVTNNKSDGISASAAVVSGSTATNNSGSGINCPIGPPNNCTILNNVASQNGDAGISFVGTVSNNTTTGNTAEGIRGIGQISNNTVIGNGSDGITAFDGPSSVISNSIGQNGSFGIAASPLSSFGNNQIFENNGESSGTHKTTPQTQGGVQISPNICDGNTVCPGP